MAASQAIERLPSLAHLGGMQRSSFAEMMPNEMRRRILFLMEREIGEGFDPVFAGECITDMTMFLHAAGNHVGAELGGLSPSEPVDEAWHAALLDSSYYERFCLEHFGFYLHHFPYVPNEDGTMPVGTVTSRSTFETMVAAGYPLLAELWLIEGDGAKCDNPVKGCKGPACRY